MGYSNWLVDLVALVGKSSKMAVKSLADLLAEGVAGRGVLVRCDLNVPLADGVITDPGRIDARFRTLICSADAGAKRDRPHTWAGPRTARTPSCRWPRWRRGARGAVGPARPVGRRCGRHRCMARAEGLTDGDVLLLENIRFDPRKPARTTPSVWRWPNRLPNGR